MATITFSTLTIPTPQPYDNKNSSRNLEDMCYVILQILQQAKTAGVVISDQGLAAITTAIGNLSLSVPPADFEELTQAVQDLRFNSITLDFGRFRMFYDGKNVEFQ